MCCPVIGSHDVRNHIICMDSAVDGQWTYHATLDTTTVGWAALLAWFALTWQGYDLLCVPRLSGMWPKHLNGSVLGLAE